MQARYFEGAKGETQVIRDVPPELLEQAQAVRALMLERLADVDEEIGELFLMEEEPTAEQLHAAIRRQTIALQFVPVFMGSAFKNRGVHALLDGVTAYLPAPTEVENVALDLSNDEEPVVLTGNPSDRFVALAFKLEQGRFGQLTYMRVYQGKIEVGETIHSMADSSKVRVCAACAPHVQSVLLVRSACVGAGAAHPVPPCTVADAHDGC